jgi:hypothetical protein
MNVDAMTKQELLALYNERAAASGSKTRKYFETKGDALKALEAFTTDEEFSPPKFLEKDDLGRTAGTNGAHPKEKLPQGAVIGADDSVMETIPEEKKPRAPRKPRATPPIVVRGDGLEIRGGPRPGQGDLDG